jgi:hypothetical protein
MFNIRALQNSIMRLVHLLMVVGLFATPNLASAQASTDSGSFVVRHGSEIVATERFARTPTQLEGTLAIHNAKKTSQRYTAMVAPDATLPLIEVTVREGEDTGAVKGRVVERARVIFRQDSVAVDAVTGNGLVTRIFGTKTGAVPYLNLSFALLEQAVRRAFAAPKATAVPFFNLGGGQTISAELVRLSPDSVRVDIGTTQFRLRIDSAGRVLGGGIPAQGVVVQRN